VTATGQVAPKIERLAVLAAFGFCPISLESWSVGNYLELCMSFGQTRQSNAAMLAHSAEKIPADSRPNRYSTTFTLWLGGSG
jgi:hypothetical protein